jgi:uncharacterized protein
MPGAADFLTALGLAFVIEGLLFSLFPHRIRSVMEAAEQLGPEKLRLLGFASVAAGVFVVWLVRGLSV